MTVLTQTLTYYPYFYPLLCSIAHSITHLSSCPAALTPPASPPPPALPVAVCIGADLQQYLLGEMESEVRSRRGGGGLL